jgi:hypothetical protein
MKDRLSPIFVLVVDVEISCNDANGGMIGQKGDLAFELLRLPFVIVVDKGYKITFCMGEGGISCPGRTGAFGQAVDLDPAIPRAHPLYDVMGGGRGCVVDDVDLELPVGLSEH